METRHLQIFTAVYRTRSFTRAAEELFTSQPTISEHMKNLEDRIGCKLFDRLGRSISPTPEADLLYPKAVAILDEMHKLETGLATAAKTVSGELIIGASTIPGEYLLPARAAQFNNSYPELSFEIMIKDSGRIIDDISAHRIYLGVVGAELPATNLKFIPFDRDELVLAAASVMDIPMTIALNDLVNFDFLIREQGSGTGSTVNHCLNQAGIDQHALRIRATLGSSTAIKEAVKTGLGIAFISTTAIREELSQGTVKSIEVEGLSMKRSFFVVIQKKRTLPFRYQLFKDFLIS
ncbi:MAG: LysR family transcriptional regulator [Desulfofustis sp.]|nr:LysR family transcriptional regulator [Desulfofustis sp.]MBT8346321.1 LysR family transcriptional regulator [Desulfofustis sp.]NNF46575.1 LysR family transcriptional regulator [Desulfofustis sp.]NNK14560.1 LysR family transcriptional regulator [Desulfofustis sp.]RZW20641.1 MAG: LysR family transcriptional regulator [Desulfobulbaceae bacterium]